MQIKTDTKTLLEFKYSYRSMAFEYYGFMTLGIIMILCSIFFPWYAISSAKHKEKQTENDERKEIYLNNSVKTSGILRIADNAIKHKVLLQAKIDNYDICYRRVKRTNELVINGYVYDEMTALLEFPHSLKAKIDGNYIEVGLLEDGFSYIEYNYEIIKEKRRII